MKRILFTLVLSFTALSIWAHDIEVANDDGVTIYYNYSDDGKELIVTYRGDRYDSYEEYSGSVVIPEDVTYMNRTRKVTSIGDRAFYGCTGLTAVTIPNSVTAIESSAFFGCSGLTAVTIPNSVTAIGEAAFRRCSGLISVTIPNSVTAIRSTAFYGCTGLTSVHISDIDAWCKISFASNPLYYAHHLFLNGVEIKKLVIPNSVTVIGQSAFSGCSGLTSVTIPNSVISIGSSAFSGCI